MSKAADRTFLWDCVYTKFFPSVQVELFLECWLSCASAFSGQLELEKGADQKGKSSTCRCLCVLYKDPHLNGVLQQADIATVTASSHTVRCCLASGRTELWCLWSATWWPLILLRSCPSAAAWRVPLGTFLCCSQVLATEPQCLRTLHMLPTH